MSKKGIFLIIILFSLFITNIEALETKKICNNQLNYYYFLYPLANQPECHKIIRNMQDAVVCNDNDTTILKKTESDLWDEVKLESQLTVSASFDKSLLNDDYDIFSVQTIALTEFTKEQFYLFFDGFITNDINKDGNYVWTETLESGAKVYHHLYGNLNSEEKMDNIFEQIKIYYDSLNNEQKTAYREKIVTDMYNAQIPSVATLGTGNAETFEVLPKENLNLIYDSHANIAIQRELKPTVKVKPMYYFSNKEGTMRNLTFLLPARIEVVIATDCKIKTCEEIKKQYENCQNDVCPKELIKEYEACNPIQKVKNPETNDKNILLVCLVIISMIVLAISTYNQKNKTTN